MRVEVKSYNNNSSLVSAILFFILGAIMFTNPDTMVIVISRILGGILILFGLYSCIKNYILVRQNTQLSAIPMVAGISCMAIGSVFFFAAGFVEAMVRFVIGGWILLSGIMRFANAMQIDKKNNPKFFSLLIISLLLILAGLYTILEANLAFQTIGIVLMIYAGLEIFGWLTNKSVVKETMTKEEKKKKRSKNKDVVDAVIIKDDTDEKKNSKK